jgi:hypothetical protein
MKECQWCGLMHGVKCPVVKAIEYHENGAVKRVEFLTPGDTTRHSLAGLSVACTWSASADVADPADSQSDLVKGRTWQ